MGIVGSARRATTILSTLAGVAALTGVTAAVPASAEGPTACVTGGACYAGLQDAIDAAPTGGTIRLSAGEFAGGVRITRSVNLAGAGASTTTVRGGGPVILVLSTQDTDVPAVRITDLTVTGGLTDGFAGEPGFNALGGGIASLGVDTDDSPSLYLRRVVVTGNTAAPANEYPGDSGVPCPDDDCPYAGAYGGGIFAGGEAWIVDSTISGNVAGGQASDTDGAGVFSTDALHVIRSVVADNRAAPAPHDIGRFAEGAGIFAAYGGLDLRDSEVSGNVAELVTDYPAFAGDGSVIFMAATGGGVHVGSDSPARIVGSRLTGNTVRTINPQGEGLAYDSAMLVADSPLTMRHSLVSDNLAYVESGTSADVGPSGQVLETDAAARIVQTRIVDNRSIALSSDGVAGVSGGLGVFDLTDSHHLAVMRDSEISGNVAIARSETGSARIYGGGVLNNANLRLAGTRVVDNVGRADAPETTAQGGGVWSGQVFDGPDVDLDLRGSRITGNRLIALGGLKQGGGLFTTFPVALTNTVINANRPDDCYGCDLTLAAHPQAQPPVPLRPIHTPTPYLH